MKRSCQICILIAIIFVSLLGCTKKQAVASYSIVQTDGYEKISPEAARQAMDSDNPYIVLDVRFENEFELGHLPEAILIPVTELEERAEAELPDKDMLILVYCESGPRSKKAAELLIEMGYTFVKDMGGIEDWLW